MTTTTAVLVLEDGTRYEGPAYGARGRTLGEAVFATGMSGYQETLTDPSYAGQLVVMTELLLRGPQTVGEVRGRASRRRDQAR